MTYDEACKLLKPELLSPCSVRFTGLDSWSVYYTSVNDISLDGGYDLKELEAICVFVKECPLEHRTND